LNRERLWRRRAVKIVEIELANPTRIDVDYVAPSTLCTLKVRLRNGGARTISFFAFSVEIDGQDAPLYKLQT